MGPYAVLRSKEKAGRVGLSKCQKSEKRVLYLKEIYLLVLEPNELLVCLIHKIQSKIHFGGHLFFPGGSGLQRIWVHRKCRLYPWVRKHPLRKGKWQPTADSSLGNFMNRGA